MLAMYWDIGRMIEQRQKLEGWGAAVIPRLARDIRNELPEVKGFSERNIGYMIRFCAGICRGTNFAAGRCKIAVGPPCHSDGEDQRLVDAVLVHDGDYRTRLEP